MPWYWTDDLAQTLLASGQIDPETAQRLTMTPVAVRGVANASDPAPEDTAASGEASDDDELPLAA